MTMPPTVPGDPEPQIFASAPPEPPTHRRRLAIPVLAGLVVVLAAAVAWLLVFGSPFTIGGSIALADAQKTCGPRLRQYGTLTNDGKTYLIDLASSKEAGATTEDLACVLKALKAPSHVEARMARTRAIDGRQSERWANIEASWIYDPDHGLDVIIREVS